MEQKCGALNSQKMALKKPWSFHSKVVSLQVTQTILFTRPHGGRLGAIWPPDRRRAQNEPPEAIWEPLGHQSSEQLRMSLEAIWEPFSHQSPEQLKMSLQRPSGSYLATRAQNSSKRAYRGHLGGIWPPEPRTAQNQPPEAIWEPLGHQNPEHSR